MKALHHAALCHTERNAKAAVNFEESCVVLVEVVPHTAPYNGAGGSGFGPQHLSSQCCVHMCGVTCSGFDPSKRVCSAVCGAHVY
jgi:hypothetical protein